MKFLIVLLLLIPGSILSQQSYTIQGTVNKENNTPSTNMTVSLYYKGAKDTLRQLTNDKGVFVFKNIPNKEFHLTITGIGYERYSKEMTAEPGKNNIINLPDTRLATVAGLLSEVVVRSNTKIDIKEDTISYKADSFQTKPNDMTEDLLKKLPGVQVDRDGNVTAHGKTVTKVKVNGKDFFSGDVKTATREIPVELIDKIQVIDDYGDQSAFTGVKDGEPEKIINLQLKSDKVKGYFGNSSLGIGTDERYKASITVHNFNDDQQLSVMTNLNNVNSNLFNFSNPALTSGRGSTMMGMTGSGSRGSGISGGPMVPQGTGNTSQTSGNTTTSNNGISDTKSVGLNYRDNWGKKVTVYGNYVYTEKNTLAINNTSQYNFFQNNTNTVTQKTTENTKGINHRASLNIEYKADSNNYFKFSPQFSYRKNYSDSYTGFNTSATGSGKINEGTQYYTSNVSSPNISGTLLFNHRFTKKGRMFSLSINSGQSSTAQKDNSNNMTTYYLTSSNSYDSAQLQNTIQNNKSYNYGFRASYTEPVSVKNNIEFNYSRNRQFTGNDKKTYITDPATGGKAYSDSLSNIYENNYITNRFGVNFRGNEKKYNYTIGVAVQPATLKSNSFTGSKLSYTENLFNWFPVARLTFNFSRSRSFDINYSGRTSQPSYNQLQPVADVSNPQFITVGNPELNPEFTNTLNVRYNNFDFMKGDVFFSNLSFSFTKDKIVNNTINKGLGVQETRYLNDNGYYSITGFYVYSKPFQKRKYILSLNGRVSYTNNISYLDSIQNMGKNWVLAQSAKLDITLGNWLELGLNTSYSLNANKYSTGSLQSKTSNSYTFGSTSRIFLPAGFVISYDVEKTINTGYSGDVATNPFIINGYIEKQFFKKKNGTIRFEAFDLLKQNASVTRTVTGNSLTDTYSNRLGNYFMFTFSLRLSKFKGAEPRQRFPGRPPEDMMPVRYPGN